MEPNPDLSRSNNALLQYLTDFVTESRIQRMKDVASKRTRHITVVLEDIYQSHNAAAVLRSCDCAGIQDVHIIENTYEFAPSKDVSIGADKWLDLHFYKGTNNNTTDCLYKLKKAGYTICATTPHQPSIPINDLDLTSPIALVFGTEKTGLSSDALTLADQRVFLPMSGFSESLNISVTVALFIFSLTNKLALLPHEWKLPEYQQEELLIRWLINSIRNGKQLADNFKKK